MLRTNTPENVRINGMIDELEAFCRKCTPEQAAQIEDNIRMMLANLVPKSNEYLKVGKQK